MATLSELCHAGALERLEPGLPPHVQPDRFLYLAPKMRQWLENVLPGLGSSWNIEESPNEQLSVLVEDFCSGKELAYERIFKKLQHKEDGIWELKTADLRIFGWFPSKDIFILVVGDSAQRVKEIGLYAGYCGEVQRFRNALNLDEPKYVPGSDPNAVVSNYYFP